MKRIRVIVCSIDDMRILYRDLEVPANLLELMSVKKDFVAEHMRIVLSQNIGKNELVLRPERLDWFDRYPEGICISCGIEVPRKEGERSWVPFGEALVTTLLEIEKGDSRWKMAPDPKDLIDFFGAKVTKKKPKNTSSEV